MLDYKKSSDVLMHEGAKSQREPIKDELLQFIFVRCQQGISVSRHAVVLKASKVLPTFSVKSFTARYATVRRFLKAHDLVYHVGTHISQTAPELVLAEASNFIKTIRPFLYGPYQTPVYYLMHEKHILNTKGARTVNVRTSKNDSERITVAVTISTAGDVLAPTIVFKGKSYYYYYYYYSKSISLCIHC